MTLLEILYYLTIKPLELFFEVVYMMAYRIIGSPSLAIIALSLAMNFLVLPLYRRADAMQEEERKTEERLGAGVQHIKKTFKGDEQMMILQTYYRQNHYKQSYVLRGSLPLLLEVPFFIAAYRFLSSLEILHGVSFGPIADLGSPDGLIVIGGLAINLLPILMTLINIISSSIYADHMSRKTRIQLYVMAAIFLVFLYDSPAGLVFYWTLNNLFSLIKNVFYKLPNPRKVLRIMGAVIGIAAAGYFGIVYQTPSTLRKLVLVGAACLLVLISVVKLPSRQRAAGASSKVSTNSVFFSGIIYLVILVGGLIPSAVIESSPEDFVSAGTFYHPMDAVWASVFLASGLFLIWCGLFYFLAGENRRRQMAWIVVVGGVVATLDYMVFKPESKSGTLSSTLVYEHGLVSNTRLMLFGLVAMLAVLMIVALTARRLGGLWRSVMQVMAIVAFVMTVMNVVSINQRIDSLLQKTEYADQHYTEPELTLSSTGKNVVVIMLDRAISDYLPYMLQENPDLSEILDGFTYYPNTLSYGGHTNFGVPALLGGYEYTPLEMNLRAEESLKDKHDEALLSVPVLFSESGYDVTVCDPPYAGYDEHSDMSIYDDYPEITATRTEGRLNPDEQQQEYELYQVRKRNLFCYSVVRCMPLVIQKALYNEGQYNAAPSTSEDPYATVYAADGAHQSTGYDRKFTDAYTVLENLDEITETSANETGSYVFLLNNTVHEGKLLQEPSYTPEYEVDNTEYDAAHADRFTIDGKSGDVSNELQLSTYESQMAAFLQLGKWFDYLRENDLYDNTRIIIVSDHSYNLESFTDRILEDGIDTMQFNPLLLVKDYNAHGFETSEEFMTNADVPYLSVQGLIENAANPFTGKEITTEAKSGLQYVIVSEDFTVTKNNGNQFSSSEWLSVKGDVRDIENWTIVSKDSVLPDLSASN